MSEDNINTSVGHSDYVSVSRELYHLYLRDADVSAQLAAVQERARGKTESGHYKKRIAGLEGKLRELRSSIEADAQHSVERQIHCLESALESAYDEWKGCHQCVFSSHTYKGYVCEVCPAHNPGVEPGETYSQEKLEQKGLLHDPPADAPSASPTMITQLKSVMPGRLNYLVWVNGVVGELMQQGYIGPDDLAFVLEHLNDSRTAPRLIAMYIVDQTWRGKGKLKKRLLSYHEPMEDFCMRERSEFPDGHRCPGFEPVDASEQARLGKEYGRRIAAYERRLEQLRSEKK